MMVERQRGQRTDRRLGPDKPLNETPHHALKTTAARGSSRSPATTIRGRVGEGAIPVECLASVGNEHLLTDKTVQIGLGQPVIPSDLRGIRLDRFLHNDLMQAEPVRADRSLAEELEHEPRTSLDTQLLRQLPRRRVFIRLSDVHGSPKHPVELPGEQRDIVRTTMHLNPPIGITAHDRRYAMHPSVPDRRTPVHNAQHAIVLIDPLNQFTHEPHDGRGRRQPDSSGPLSPQTAQPAVSSPTHRSKKATDSLDKNADNSSGQSVKTPDQSAGA
jgi:hypothetical protein